MRLAPSASARSTISPILSILARCTTALTVSGSLCRTTAAASARFLANAPLVAGDVVSGSSLAVLDGDLHVVEPGFSQRAEGLLGGARSGRKEIAVKAGRAGAGGDVDEVTPRAGLATRQVHLQDAELRRFAKDAQPGRGVELVLPCIERERIRAIGAAERTAMGQLGEEPERLMQHCGTCEGRVVRRSSVTLSQLQKPLVGQAAQQRAHIGENFLTRRRIALREVVDDLAESDLAGAVPDDLGRDRVGLEYPFRRKQDPAALRLVVDETHAARQSRPRLGRDDGARIAQATLQSCGMKAPGGICFGAT